MSLDEDNVNLAVNNFLEATNSAPNKNVAQKGFNKGDLKYKTKPWITTVLQKQFFINKTIS